MGKKECETCVRRKTEFCPPSYQCFSTDSKPFYQDRIMLLKDNNDLVSQYRYVEKLKEEVKELKKQLETGEEQYNDLVEEKEKLQEQLSSNTLKLDNQQKEFIEYLEEQSQLCKDKIFERVIIGKDLTTQLLKLLLKTYKEILSKYKEIIGDKE